MHFLLSTVLIYFWFRINEQSKLSLRRLRKILRSKKLDIKQCKPCFLLQKLDLDLYLDLEMYDLSQFLSPEACLWTNRKSWNTIHSKLFIRKLRNYLGIFSNMGQGGIFSIPKLLFS